MFLDVDLGGGGAYVMSCTCTTACWPLWPANWPPWWSD